MAAGQGFIEFSTGDVLTASAANGYLASQVVMVFASAAARTSAIASPQEGMISYLKDTNAVEYYSGSAWTAVGGGGGGGKVLQVVQATSSTDTSVAGTTWGDTTLSASITPSSASSKVMVFTMQTSGVSGTTNASFGAMRLVRGSTTIWNTADYGYGLFVAGASSNTTILRWVANISYLDSPATTSSTTYKTQVRGEYSNQTFATQLGGNVSTMILMEIGA